MMAVMLYETRADGRYVSWHSLACQNTPNEGLYGFANFIYLISKVWEWIDTYFLIIYDKGVIPLHFFHHMTTFTMAALTHNFPVGGFAHINCLVHFIMYARYGKVFKIPRILVTSLQLLQLICVSSIHTYGFMQPQGECFDFSGVAKEWYYCQGVVVVYFLLFIKFFIDNYVTAPSGKKDL
jgi:hypothetical protein